MKKKTERHIGKKKVKKKRKKNKLKFLFSLCCNGQFSFVSKTKKQDRY